MSFLLSGSSKGKTSSLDNWTTIRIRSWASLPMSAPFQCGFVTSAAIPSISLACTKKRPLQFYLSLSCFISITEPTERTEIIRPSFIFFRTSFLETKDPSLNTLMSKISKRPVICPLPIYFSNNFTSHWVVYLTNTRS